MVSGIVPITAFAAGVNYINKISVTYTAPNYKAKWNNVINSTVAAFNDIPTTVKSSVEEKIYRAISSVTSLY